MRKTDRKRSRRGNTIIEFALCTLMLIPLLLGTFTIGMSLGRTIQTIQVSRDAGHMYVRFVDFSLTANQEMIVRLARGMNMTLTGGNGVVILTKVTYVTDTQCTEAGLSLAACLNRNRHVVLQQLKIGNTSLRSSTIGNPDASILDAKGQVTGTNHLTNTSARADGLTSVLSLQVNEFAYVSEAYFIAPEFNFPGYLTASGLYARTIF